MENHRKSSGFAKKTFSAAILNAGGATSTLCATRTRTRRNASAVTGLPGSQGKHSLLQDWKIKTFTFTRQCGEESENFHFSKTYWVENFKRLTDGKIAIFTFKWNARDRNKMIQILPNCQNSNFSKKLAAKLHAKLTWRLTAVNMIWPSTKNLCRWFFDGWSIWTWWIIYDLCDIWHMTFKKALQLEIKTLDDVRKCYSSCKNDQFQLVNNLSTNYNFK